jgi:threonine/homoserine/homoserine lactone efflux protein
MGVIHLGVFIGAIFALSALPGPDMMFIVARSVAHGRRAGAVSVLGIITAVLAHTLIVALGLSALLRAVPAAFTAVKLAGACYLVYLGIEALCAAGHPRAPSAREADADARSVCLTRLYVQGFTTGLLNPKTTLFFAALLPQFVEPGSRQLLGPYLLLGALVAAIAGLCDLAIALASALLARRLRASPRRAAWTHRLCGSLYVGLGLNLLREW